jgi:hypothetical protein
MEVSLPAVQKAVKNGRIKAITDANGKLKGIDWETQKDDWIANSNPAFRRKQLGYNPEGSEATPFPAGEGKAVGGRPRKDEQTATDTPEPPDADKRSGMSLAEIKRARELVNLNRDKLSLDVERKKYIPADEQNRVCAALGAALISALYNIPAKVAPELASMTDARAIRDMLQTEIDQAVEDISKAYAH